jgi:hypothetical protein
MGETAKLWNISLKNGSNSNMAVNGSVTPKEFSYTATGTEFDINLEVMCLIAEFSGSPAIGNKFIADAIGTLTNGLLVEAKVDDVTYTFGNLKRTRDLIEVSQPQGGFNVIAGTTSLLQIFFYMPHSTRLVKHGIYGADDFIKATVRDDLSSLTFLEIFLQGVKL